LDEIACRTSLLQGTTEAPGWPGELMVICDLGQQFAPHLIMPSSNNFLLSWLRFR